MFQALPYQGEVYSHIQVEAFLRRQQHIPIRSGIGIRCEQYVERTIVI